MGGRFEVVITGGDVVTGHDLDTGRERWRADGLNPENNGAYRIVASPVVKDGVIYAPTRVKPLLALRTGGEGDITESHRIWSFDRGPDVPSPVTDGKRFYVVTDNGVLYALDAKTGEVLLGPTRLPSGTYSASPVLAEGRLYVINEDGVASVVRLGDGDLEILASNDMGAYTLSSMAMSDGQIFLRTAEALYCISRRRGRIRKAVSGAAAAFSDPAEARPRFRGEDHEIGSGDGDHGRRARQA